MHCNDITIIIIIAPLCRVTVVFVCVCLFVSLIFSGMRLGADSQFSDFLDGLGPGQLVGRQTLATPAMGK